MEVERRRMRVCSVRDPVQITIWEEAMRRVCKYDGGVSRPRKKVRLHHRKWAAAFYVLVALPPGAVGGVCVRVTESRCGVQRSRSRRWW